MLENFRDSQICCYPNVVDSGDTIGFFLALSVAKIWWFVWNKDVPGTYPWTDFHHFSSKLKLTLVFINCCQVFSKFALVDEKYGSNVKHCWVFREIQTIFVSRANNAPYFHKVSVFPLIKAFFEKIWKRLMNTSVTFDLEWKWWKSVRGCPRKFASPGTSYFHKNHHISAMGSITYRNQRWK